MMDDVKKEIHKETSCEETLRKDVLRKEALKRRADLTGDERFRSQLLITDRIIGHQWYYSATDLLVYKSYGSEVATDEIIRDALKRGKRVFLPRVNPNQEGSMDFIRIGDLSEVAKGFKGISEPVGDEIFTYDDTKKDVLMIMPGAVFDVRRNRIGYGGGYYDRYLSDKPLLHTIAIGFSCQMTAEIPVGEFDIRPMQVICL